MIPPLCAQPGFSPVGPGGQFFSADGEGQGVRVWGISFECRGYKISYHCPPRMVSGNSILGFFDLWNTPCVAIPQNGVRNCNNLQNKSIFAMYSDPKYLMGEGERITHAGKARCRALNSVTTGLAFVMHSRNNSSEKMPACWIWLLIIVGL